LRDCEDRVLKNLATVFTQHTNNNTTVGFKNKLKTLAFSRNRKPWCHNYAV